MKIVLFCFVIMSLSACNLMPETQTQAPVVNLNGMCESRVTNEIFDEYCDWSAWTQALVEYSTLSWNARSEKISKLDSQPHSLLQKVLLSHGNDTPYQNRLRSQNWITTLQTVTDKSMTQLLDIVFFQSNQQLLELESAITILSQVNARQAKTITAQEALLIEKDKLITMQQQQVEQLLDVEASMVNQGRRDN